jgi:phage/plasmid-like protein (TIGR03299 family)
MTVTDHDAPAPALARAPWGDLITTQPGEYATAEQMLVGSGLDWEVGFTPVYRPEKVRQIRRVVHREPYVGNPPASLVELGPDEEPLPGEEVFTKEKLVIAKDLRDVRRLDTDAVLGTVKGQYNLLSNREAFAFADHLVDDGEAAFVAAGSQRGGKRVLMVMELLQGSVLVDGEDPVNKFLLLRTGHDGGTPLTASVIPFRFQCSNALPRATRQAQWSWKITHTGTMTNRIEEARETLRLTHKYDEEWEREMRRLLDIQVSDDRAHTVIKDAVLKVKTQSSEKSNEDLVEDIFRTYLDSTVNGYQGTGYGLFLGATEHLDHYVTRRSNSLNARFDSIVSPSGDAFRISNEVARVLTGANA